jgi:hypothetical protein
MHIEDGGLIFDNKSEAPAIISVFEGDAACHIEDMYLHPLTPRTDFLQAQRIVRSLHGVITDSRLPESRREEATNQIMFIALTGLRSTQVYDQRLRDAERESRQARSFGDAASSLRSH